MMLLGFEGLSVAAHWRRRGRMMENGRKFVNYTKEISSYQQGRSTA
jgi:hypothetical protein